MPGPDEKVGMVREQSPGVDGPGPGLCEKRQARDEVVPVGVVAEDGRPLDSPHHDMVEGVGRIEASLARHGQKDRPGRDRCQVVTEPTSPITIILVDTFRVGCYS